jgi:hypothetical protein
MNEVVLANVPKKVLHYVVSTHGLVALTSGVSPLVMWSFGLLSWSWSVWLIAPLAILGFATVGVLTGWPEKPLPESAWMTEHLLLTKEPSMEYALDTQEKTAKWLKSDEAIAGVGANIRKDLLSLSDKISKVLMQLEKSLQSEAGFEVMKIATYHLPKAIRAYITVPMSRVDDLKNENGKTANMLLKQSISEFIGVLEKVEAKVASKGLEELSVESHIVSKKYGERNSV